MSVQVLRPAGREAADGAIRRIAEDGTAAHRYPRGGTMERGRHATANVADLVHNLCVLHGRHPGMIDLAVAHDHGAAARDWLTRAADGFVTERTLIAALVSAAGPMPSTPGQAETEAAVLGQRHALETLAESDRTGCAIGAVGALLLDWEAMRAVLDRAAARLGIEAPASNLPGRGETAAMLASLAAKPAAARAAAFGIEQLVLQHRGFWDLIEARHSARDHD